MLTLTQRAREKLREAIQTRTENPAKGMRLCMTPTGFAPLDFVLDEEREGDQVVTGEDGCKVLIVGPMLAEALREMVIDCRGTPAGSMFTIAKKAPVN